MLYVHRAERGDALLDMLGDLVSVPLDDPMTAEVVAVPTRGVERWLVQRLATRLGATPGRQDGVCANIDFPFPGTLVGRGLAAASGIDPDTDPWAPERSVWPLLDVVDACLDEPWLAPLAAHLRGAGGDGETRRFAGVRHIADLFDRYSVHRPAMVRAWAGGANNDPAGTPLPPDALWQPVLWRHLRHGVGVPSPAERLPAACTRLRDEPTLVDMPGRVSLFGLTRLPASYLDVLASLADGRDVHLFLLHPSPVLWERVAGVIGSGPVSLRRADQPAAIQVANPLLASWGRDAREMQLVLSATAGAGDGRNGAGGGAAIDDHRALTDTPSTLLGRIQADIRADRAVPGLPIPGRPDPRAVLDPEDHSIEVHACHGRGRQVEVIRDAILHLLAEDPTLETRDVIVMCPDIETYAPLIDATFGAGQQGDVDDPDDEGGSGVPALRVRLADRSLRQTNPVLGVVATLLELASSRVTASEVLDLMGREPVRRRFGFDADDLSRLEQWITGAGVRWGFDAPHRDRFGLGDLDAGTWKTGLDRTLLGVTMADAGQRIVAGVVPLDDVDSGDIRLVGRYAEVVERLEDALATFSKALPLAGWAAAIAVATDALCATTDRDAWQQAEVHRLLDDVVTEAGGGSNGALLTLGDVVSVLGDRLAGRPTRANFRTGQLTMCTLVPMRSVPHRVVCLLGLDDGVFPRAGERDGDDLTLADPCVGDRDARSEDRQLLLDALLAATDHLVITYTGRDERTNLERPPSVPVGELLDVVERTVRPAGGGSARHQVVVRHPLQPFDARNFRPGVLGGGGPWSFDAINLEGAIVRDAPRRAMGPFLAGPLGDPPGSAVELVQLERFLRHPARAFLRERLGVYLDSRAEEIDDALPVELDALAEWGVGDRLLAARLAGADAESCLAAERARGLLPPGGLAAPMLKKVAATVEEIVAVAGAGGAPDSLDVHVDLADASLTGVVPGITGDVIRTTAYSRLGPVHRLIAWARLLAVSAAHPERPFEAVTIGRPPKGSGCAVARIPPLAPDAAGRRAVATAELSRLVELFRRNLREPLPLACKTSATWAANGNKAAKVAAPVWDSAFERPGESDDPEHRLVHGDTIPFERLLEEAPRPDEGGDGWPDEPTRFGLYAHALWDPLLARETVGDA